jgi:hypothetical protein
MFDHGYKASAVNRDLSAVGSAYRRARKKRLAPRGFKSPALASSASKGPSGGYTWSETTLRHGRRFEADEGNLAKFHLLHTALHI